MSADQLKEAALRAELTPESLIQQSGHADWVPATNVRGLTFPTAQQLAEAGHLGLAPDTPSISAVPAAPAPTPAAGANSAGASARQPRFATIRDLLGLYLNGEVEVNLPDSSEYSQAILVMVGNDHFEVTLDSGRGRVFVPYSRIRVIWVTETSSSATLAYREAHRISIELEAKK